MEVKIETSWKEVLNKEFKSTYFLQTAAHIKTELDTGAKIFPVGNHIFNAFNLLILDSRIKPDEP
jgi:uracil-DNA glycosylase